MSCVVKHNNIVVVVIRNNEISISINNERKRTFQVFTNRITYSVMKLCQIIVESVEKGILIRQYKYSIFSQLYVYWMFEYTHTEL